MWVVFVLRNFNVISSWRRGGIGRFFFVGVDKLGSCFRRFIMVFGWNLYFVNMLEVDKFFSGFDLFLKLCGMCFLLVMCWCVVIFMKVDDILSINLKVWVSFLVYLRFKFYIFYLEYIFCIWKFYNYNLSMYFSLKFLR